MTLKDIIDRCSADPRLNEWHEVRSALLQLATELLMLKAEIRVLREQIEAKPAQLRRKPRGGDE